MLAIPLEENETKTDSTFVFDDGEPLTDLDKILPRKEKKQETQTGSRLTQIQKNLLTSFSAEDARKLANRASAESVTLSLKMIMMHLKTVATSNKIEEQATISDFIGQAELDILRDLKFQIQVISSDKVIISWHRTPIDGCTLAMLDKFDKELLSSMMKKYSKLDFQDVFSAYGIALLQINTKKPCRDLLFDRIRLVCFHMITDAAKRKSTSVLIIPFAQFGNALTPIEKVGHFDALISDLKRRGFNMTDIYRFTPQQITVSITAAPTVQIVDEKKETSGDESASTLRSADASNKQPKFFQNKEAFKLYCRDELTEYTTLVMNRIKNEDSSKDEILRNLFESVLNKMEYAFVSQPTEPLPWKAVH